MKSMEAPRNMGVYDIDSKEEARLGCKNEKTKPNDADTKVRIEVRFIIKYGADWLFIVHLPTKAFAGFLFFLQQ